MQNQTIANEAMLHKHQVTIEALKSKSVELLNTKNKLLSSIKDKDQEIDRLAKQLNNTQQELALSRDTLNDAINSRERIEEVKRVLETRLIVLTSEMKTLQVSSSRFESQLRDAKQQVHYLLSKETTMKETIRWYQGNLTQLKTLQTLYESAQDIIRQDQQQKESLLNENNRLKKTVTELRNQIDSQRLVLQTQVAKYQDQIDHGNNMQTELKHMVEEQTNIYDSIANTLQKEIQGKDETISRLHEHYIGQFGENRRDVYSQIGGKSRNKGAEAVSDEEISAINNVYYVIAEIKSRNQLLRKLHEKYATLLTQEAMLKKEVFDLKEGIQQKNKTIGQLETQRRDYNKQLEGLEKEVHKLKAHNLDQEKELKDMYSRCEYFAWENQACHAILKTHLGPQFKSIVENTKSSLLGTDNFLKQAAEVKYTTVSELIQKNRQLQQSLLSLTSKI